MSEEQLIKKYIADQALVAVLKAAEKEGVLDTVVSKATTGLLGGDPEYAWVCDASERGGDAVNMINDAVKTAKRMHTPT